MLDFKAYIRRMEALDPEYPLIVEGAQEAELRRSVISYIGQQRNLGSRSLDPSKR